MARYLAKTKKPVPAMERRQRLREQTIASILDVARDVMREQGVAALNVNEVARRVGMRPQSLAEYFPNKAAMYDTLYRMGIRLMRAGDDRALAEHGPDWERVRAWFEHRAAIAKEYPELYLLVLGSQVPGFVPSAESLQEVSDLLNSSRRGMAEIIEAGVMEPRMPLDRAVDILLTAQHGVIAEALGKELAVPERSARFRSLIPDVVAIYRTAWEPRHDAWPAAPDVEGDAGRQKVRCLREQDM